VQGAAECGLVLVGPSHVYANDKRRRLADSAAPHAVDDAANFGAKAGGRGHKEVAHDLCGRVCVSVGECVRARACVCVCTHMRVRATACSPALATCDVRANTTHSPSRAHPPARCL